MARKVRKKRSRRTGKTVKTAGTAGEASGATTANVSESTTLPRSTDSQGTLSPGGGNSENEWDELWGPAPGVNDPLSMAQEDYLKLKNSMVVDQSGLTVEDCLHNDNVGGKQNGAPVAARMEVDAGVGLSSGVQETGREINDIHLEDLSCLQTKTEAPQPKSATTPDVHSVDGDIEKVSTSPTSVIVEIKTNSTKSASSDDLNVSVPLVESVDKNSIVSTNLIGGLTKNNHPLVLDDFLRYDHTKLRDVERAFFEQLSKVCFNKFF